jgi:hypothetical protein
MLGRRVYGVPHTCTATPPDLVDTVTIASDSAFDSPPQVQTTDITDRDKYDVRVSSIVERYERSYNNALKP